MAQPNKSDRIDSRGIAQMMRVNLFRPVHVKTLTSQKPAAGQGHCHRERHPRDLAQFRAQGRPGQCRKFEQRIHELAEGLPDLIEIFEPLLDARSKLRQHFAALHRKVLVLAREHETCRRLMTVPGIGPGVALAYTATIDIPSRFRSSKAVGPVLGLTPSLNESGESRRVGRISLCGDAMLPHAAL